MTIDSIANRYGCLPSEILARGTTVDMFFFQKAAKIRAIRKDGLKVKPPGSYTVEELLKLNAEADKVGK